MSVEIPYDLIKEVQIAVLKEANLLSYDPDKPSIPNLPSLESSISELDPSPPYLRCKHCKGRLLRGVLSLICVFCGKQQAQQETAPEPINFQSTFGCQWLLQSLGLDGSEIAGLPFRANESNRGQEEFPLSDFLDLEIKWRPELEKVETESNRSPLNLVGVNLDNFFAEGKRETVTEERLQEDENDDGSGDNDFQVRDNYKSFENVQRFQPAVRSTEDKSGGDSFDDWEASFQSADDGNTHEESKSNDPVVGSSVDISAPVVGSSVDISAHMDAVFGSGKGFGEDKENISSASKTNDWFQDDLWSSSKSEISGKSKVVELTANMKDGTMVENVNNPSSMSIDLIRDDQWKNESNRAPDNRAIHEEDASFDACNAFTSSTTLEHPANTGDPNQFEVSAIVQDGGEVEKANNSSSRSIDLVKEDQLQANKVERPADKAIDEEDDSFDDWNDFASSTSVQDTSNRQISHGKQFEVTANFKDGEMAENAKSSSMSFDWFQDDQWQTTSKKAPDNKSVNVDDDFVDAWNDFTSSTSAKDPSKIKSDWSIQFEATTTIKDDRMVGSAGSSTSVAWSQDDNWPAISNGTSDSKTIDEGNDSFDAWNDFTGSTGTKDFPNEQTGSVEDSEITANVKDHRTMEVNNSSFDWFHGNQGQTNSNQGSGGITTDEGYDSFDAWNGFTGSTSAQDPSFKQSVNHMSPSVEQTSDINFLVASNNLQNDDFGSFSQAHFFSGAFSDQSGSKEVNITKSEPSVSKRIPDVNVTNGENTGEAIRFGDVSNTTTKSATDDVEMLMSQMHDLSFMLASNLSIPSKQDDSRSFSKD